MEGVYKLGPIRLASGDIYLGEWLDKTPCGYGVLIFTDGAVFEGFLLRGLPKFYRLPHGEGRFIHSSGSVYEGEFISGKGGKAQGFGTYCSKNYVIKGTWYDNLPNGSCTEIWTVSPDIPALQHPQTPNQLQMVGLSPIPMGSQMQRMIQTLTICFSGGFLRGKKNGSGSATWPNGDKLTGHFCDGVLSGFGKLFWKESSIKYEGNFEQDMIQGTGKLEYPGGAIYKGEFKNDFPHGKGIFETEDKVFDGSWANGLQEGIGSVFIKAEGKTIHAVWSKGMMNMPDVPQGRGKTAIVVTKSDKN